jgi:hypothetical protein
MKKYRIAYQRIYDVQSLFAAYRDAQWWFIESRINGRYDSDTAYVA